MQIRLLGTAAGGGFPQWNCGCANCRTARTDPTAAIPRTQSCIAVSPDGLRWFLVNASPDIRSQIESFPPLHPPTGVIRGTGIAAVLLTNADLDHVLGLFNLRESGPLVVHASPAVRRSLNDGLNLDAVLGSYNGIEWREPPGDLAPLNYPNGTPSGIHYAALVVPGKPPRYCPDAKPSPGDAVGYRFVDTTTGGRAVVIPDLGGLDEVVIHEIGNADLLLLDGTFFDADEMTRAGVGHATAAQMGHVPIGGPLGSLARIAVLTAVRRVYVHINNTNPILLENSPQRSAVESAGIEIGLDGMHFDL
jgi:pyrroloquinoline quinone biosynthesis protein B